jgi:hypothetical protein
MKNKKTIYFALAVIVSLCIVCGVAALAINAGDPNTRANQYAQEYNGNKDAYYAIFVSTDCTFLQGQFDTAYQSSQTAPAGSIYATRAIGFMKAADERMKEIGCYK